MKLLAPDGVTGIAWCGSEVAVAADRSIEVPESAVAELLAHGFRLAPAPGRDGAAEVPDGARLLSLGFGFYDVFDAAGNKLNEKRLKRADAVALARRCAGGGARS